MDYATLHGKHFSPATLSEILDISISQIHRWITAGEITAIKVSYRCTRIDGDSVARFLTRRQAVPRKPIGIATKSTLASQA